MALSLTAEQKKILSILKIDEHYIIPEYQRAYSWEYDECFQLYNDVLSAFESKEDYFIGNIILAKGEDNDYELDVVDGQQRLTTILLMMKVLSVFTKDEIFEEDCKKILGGTNRKTRKYEHRIKTEVFETTDKADLDEVLKYQENHFEEIYQTSYNNKNEFQVNKDFNHFKKNILYFYDWFSFFRENSESSIDEFIEFFLEKIYLLPIELRGATKEIANESALVIFETINNRGKNLEDADIFKAKLYHRAKRVDESKIFIDLWKTFKNSCDNLKIEIDDVFRYYSHIIRGEQGIATGETKLREFFTLKDYSPLRLKKYKETMNDLFKIIEILEFINQEKQQNTELGKWIQLIEAYTNQYPKLALVVYLYKNIETEKLDLSVLESIVRYAYYEGSTTRIKFGIYTIIKQISRNEPIDSYYKNVSVDYFNSLGNLKYGYALLAFYSNREKALERYYTDKMVSLKENKNLKWDKEKVEEFVNALGNFIVLDIPKKNTTLHGKLALYQAKSNEKTIKQDIQSLSSLKYDAFIQRDKRLKEKLVKFFKGEK